MFDPMSRFNIDNASLYTDGVGDAQDKWSIIADAILSNNMQNLLMSRVQSVTQNEEEEEGDD